jgi:hypothetical protein
MSLRYWWAPEVWRKWWVPPPLSWWIDPSGGDVAPPKPWSLWDRLLESPVTAHSTGALLAFAAALLAMRWLPVEWAAAFVAFMMVVKGQLQKGDALAPLGRYNVRNVLYRTLIGAVTAVACAGVVRVLFR